MIRDPERRRPEMMMEICQAVENAQKVVDGPPLRIQTNAEHLIINTGSGGRSLMEGAWIITIASFKAGSEVCSRLQLINPPNLI